MFLKKLIYEDAGLTTVEYAVGTCAAAGLGGLLVKLLSSDTILQLLQSLIERAFTLIFG